MILQQVKALRIVIFFFLVIFTPCFSVIVKEPILITTQKNMNKLLWNPNTERPLLAVTSKKLKVDILNMSTLQSADIINLEAGRFLQHTEWSPDGKCLVTITQQVSSSFNSKGDTTYFLSIFEISDQGEVLKDIIRDHPFESPTFYAKPHILWGGDLSNFKIVAPENNRSKEFLYTSVENFAQISQASMHISSKRQSIDCQEFFHNVQLFNLVDPATYEKILGAIIKDGLFIYSEANDLTRYVQLPGINDDRTIKQSSRNMFIAASYIAPNKVPDKGSRYVSIYDQSMNEMITTLHAFYFDWHPHSAHIIAYTHNNRTCLYDVTKKEKLATAVIEDIRDEGRYIPMTMHVAWSPTGKELVTATPDGRVYWYQVEL